VIADPRRSRRDRAPPARGHCRPQPWTGRPHVYCSIRCQAEAASIRQADRDRIDRERRQAEAEALWKAKEAANAARLERDYQTAIAAGGAVAADARWERLYDETYDKYGGRYGLCQWEDEDSNGQLTGRTCTRRTTDVYCWRHNRQLERETARRRRERERDASLNGKG
jgi:hypothetical protein